jgi:ornithine carbamoyltransferase
MKRDLVSMADVGDRLDTLLDDALRWCRERASRPAQDLKGKTLALIFEKPSTRTRVSLEVAATELGGSALYLSARDLQLGRGETVEDTARVLSRYVDGIAYRAFSHENMAALASHASVPVVNALDDLEHPCQAIADLFTMRQHFGSLEGLRIAYVGDGNNVCNSLLLGAALSGMHIVAACPAGYEPNSRIVGLAEAKARESEGSVEVVVDPEEAVADADVVYTDVWVSMGDEAEESERVGIFHPYRVTSELMARAKDEAIFMHCLPAHRGMEVTNEVIDSAQSVVFDQAENRLHAQKAILVDLLG